MGGATSVVAEEEYVDEFKGDLDGHQVKDTTDCPQCGKSYSKKINMFTHYRRTHKELLNGDGSSKLHPDLIKPNRASPPPKNKALEEEDDSMQNPVTALGEDAPIESSSLLQVGPMDSQYVATAARLFERYDLDGSGDITNKDELEQLTTNLLYTMKATTEQTAFIQGRVQAMYPQGYQWGKNWEKEYFAKWFHGSLQMQSLPPPS